MAWDTSSSLQAASKSERSGVPSADVKKYCKAPRLRRGLCPAIVVWKRRAKEGCTAEISLFVGPWIARCVCVTLFIELALVDDRSGPLSLCSVSQDPLCKRAELASIVLSGKGYYETMEGREVWLCVSRTRTYCGRGFGKVPLTMKAG